MPKYDDKKGFQFSWEEDFKILVKYTEGTIILNADKGGLVSLAKILLAFSEEQVPNNYHIHLDSYNSLEDGSCELIIEKIP